MKRLVLGMLVGTAALAPSFLHAQVRERAQEDVAADGAARVREPRGERASPEEREERREERRQRRAERLDAGDDTGAAVDRSGPDRARRREERRAARLEAGGGAPADSGRDVDRPRRDRDGDGVPDRRERRLDGDGARDARPDRMVERPAAQIFPPRRDGRADRRETRRERWNEWRDDRQDYRDDRPDYREDRRDYARSSRGAYGGGLVWNRGWRDDGRYDWNRHRRYDRDAYRLPRYYAPDGFGYDYRRFGVGASLARPLYGQDYWIDDPDTYRLPPSYGPYRWVRYWGDALLVDLRTGRVVDVVYDIFR